MLLADGERAMTRAKGNKRNRLFEDAEGAALAEVRHVSGVSSCTCALWANEQPLCVHVHTAMGQHCAGILAPVRTL